MPNPIANISTGTGQSLYRRAKELIPGGTQLLSKRPEMFLPEQWPAYYSRAKGCRVWDMDGRELIDMAYMGIGACLLGYADDDVNEAVVECVRAGSMTTLNVPEEVELAELLCEIHPWSQRVRYARSGGEAMAIAVRIARAFTGKSVVAICGYHGWADWYLAANLGSESALDGHLLPGLSPAGVPRSLQGSTLTFRFNNLLELQQIQKQYGSELAAVVMEPMRHDKPNQDFFAGVRGVADACGAVFVFDEITSGWRFNFGGVHLDFGVPPDIAVFAKATSNGFPMSAIIGRGEVMEAAQASFISSTSWTERIGPVSALATIRKMRRVGLPDHLRTAGMAVQEGWRRLAGKHSLNLVVQGQPALSTFTLRYGDQSQAMRTLFTQEMLDRGFLANSSFYASLAHDSDSISAYLGACDEAFASMVSAADCGDVLRRLRGPVAQSGFRRLT